jgi:crossover junction endodeoxyribonuclease RuvC
MYLWIDPGIRKLWYGLIDDAGAVITSGVILSEEKSPTRNDQFARMVDIFVFFEWLIDEYPIQAVGIEKLFFTVRNQNNAEFVYGVRWCLGMLFRKHTIPLYERTPQEIKKYITWNGNASKELMLAVIKKMFTLTDEQLKRHDAADAIGIALMVKNKI